MNVDINILFKKFLSFFVVLIAFGCIKAQTYSRVTTWYDGSKMNDAKVDSYIFTKKKGIYYKLASSSLGYDVKAFGAKGDGKADDTKAINRAIEVCTKVKGSLAISKGIYRINSDSVSTGIRLVDNAILNFDKDGIFKALPNKSNFYSIIRVYNVRNVIINNATVIGERDFHLGNGGEWGYGIHIENSENVTVNNASIANCWGDGIYIGNKMYSSNQRFSTNTININSPVIENCRRNGISICMGQNITVKDAVIKNINGTLPQAGIDIEPEWDRGVLPIVFDNIKIINPYTENCAGDGIQFFLNFLSDKGLSTNIAIINHKDNGSNTGVTFYKTFGKIGGAINIENPEWKNNKTHALKMIDYTYNGPPIVTISNPQIINWNRNNSSDSFFSSAISIVSKERLSNKVGNLKLVNSSFNYDKNGNNGVLNITNVTRGMGNFEVDGVKELVNVSNVIPVLSGMQVNDSTKKLVLKKR